MLEVRHHRFYVGLSKLLILLGELELLFHDLHLYFLSLLEVSALSGCFLLILEVIEHFIWGIIEGQCNFELLEILFLR